MDVNIKKVHSKPRLHVSVNLLFGVWPPCCATPWENQFMGFFFPIWLWNSAWSSAMKPWAIKVLLVYIRVCISVMYELISVTNRGLCLFVRITNHSNWLQKTAQLFHPIRSTSKLIVTRLHSFSRALYVLYKYFLRIMIGSQNQSNHSSQSQRTQIIQRTNQNSKKSQVAETKRGKTRAKESWSRSRLVLISLLIGWKNGACFLRQCKTNTIFRQSNRNRSICWVGDTIK